MTVTIQYCNTCTTTTYVGAVPGYTPGGPCHGCSPYNPGLPSTSVPAGLSTSTAVTTGAPGCTEPPRTFTRPTEDPGEPQTSQPAPEATHTPHSEPTTAPPPVATAGGVRNSAAGVGACIMAWAVGIVLAT